MNGTDFMTQQQYDYSIGRVFRNSDGVASVITRPDGTPITRPSNFTTLCNQVIRQTEVGCANCYKSDAIIGRYNPSGPIIQPCKSGGSGMLGPVSPLTDITSPIGWLGKYGTTPRLTEHEAYARVIGADESSFMEAFEAVPSMSGTFQVDRAGAVLLWRMSYRPKPLRMFSRRR